MRLSGPGPREAFLQLVLAVWAIGLLRQVSVQTEVSLGSLGCLLGPGGAGCSPLPMSPPLEKQDRSSGTLW